VHDTLKHLHRGRRGKGTTIDHFRLNEVVSQIAFGGRRSRAYQRIVSLTGVRPGDSVLDVGCSSGYLARKLAAAAGQEGHVTGVDPAQAADFDPTRRPLPLHRGGSRMRRAAATVGSLEELAAAPGYRVESAGTLPLLRYVLAIRPGG
jgi:SAM-dependent methyltransferase